MNPQQQAAFNLITVERKPVVFVTGPGGSGKSYLIQKVAEWAKENQVKYDITALTGTAAVLIGGRTLHSLLGLGLGNRSAMDCYRKLMRMRGAGDALIQRVQELALLVVDEISMMSADMLEKVDTIMRLIRAAPDVPFGGVQMVLMGDFCQLAPVDGDYCFKGRLWKEVVPQENIVVLHQLMRQLHDAVFQEVLSTLRQGRCPPSCLARLVECHPSKRKVPKGMCPTLLVAVRKEADAINQEQYQKLLKAGKAQRVFNTVYEGTDPTKSRAWADMVDVPAEVAVCMGAQVVVTMNINVDLGVVNGTRGVVMGFVEGEGGAPGVSLRLKDGRVVPIFSKQIMDDSMHCVVRTLPLQLAWALTIHKSQGMTLDAAAVDLGGIFAHGQAYVALSRVRNLESLMLVNVDEGSFSMHPEVKAFYKRLGVGAAA